MNKYLALALTGILESCATSQPSINVNKLPPPKSCYRVIDTGNRNLMIYECSARDVYAIIMDEKNDGVPDGLSIGRIRDHSSPGYLDQRPADFIYFKPQEHEVRYPLYEATSKALQGLQRISGNCCEDSLPQDAYSCDLLFADRSVQRYLE